MKHIFLTGDVGAGKSVLLRRLLPPGIPACGFLSERAQIDQGIGVYLHDPAKQRRYQTDNCVGSWENGVMCPRPEVFDTLGLTLLSNLPLDRQIVMDELGVLEEGAPLFCGRVFELLDGNRPVFGVVKDRRSRFTDAVRAHPNVELIVVTAENRERLCGLLKEYR